MNARQAVFDKWAQRDVGHLSQISQRIQSGLPPNESCSEVVGEGIYNLHQETENTLSAAAPSVLSLFVRVEAGR